MNIAVQELHVIEELIRTDLGAAQRDQEHHIPMQVHGNDMVRPCIYPAVWPLLA